jgi:hypothetical protein
VISENQNKALHAWQTSARYWDKYRVLITEMFAPLTSGLVEETQIGIGQNVLDIGGGSGEPSLTISRIVAPTGSVTYTDPVVGMLESAQAEAARRGLTNIHFRQDPDVPDAFRFAVPGKLAGILEQADAKNVIERQLNFQIEAAISFEQFWQLRTEMSETLRDKMARLTPAQLPTVKQAVADAARRYFASGIMSFTAEALIVSGRKSAGSRVGRTQ